jgi:hypothetical protein
MTPYVVIPCSARKAEGAHLPAGARYTGSFHRYAMGTALAITEPENILIASARYGLLRLDDDTEPYDLTMDAQSVDEARLWRVRMDNAACDLWVAGRHGRVGNTPVMGRPGAPLILFTPAVYTERILAAHPYFERHAVRPLPFEGCRGIGDMRHVLANYEWNEAA